MKEYLVDIKLPDELTSEFLELIPAQRQQVDQLFQEGVFFSYSLSEDRSKVWIGIHADSVEEVWNVLWSLPLMDYFEPEIRELAFHQTARNNVLEVSLN